MRWTTAPVAGLALLCATGVAQAYGTTTAFGPLTPTLSNPCAIFNAPVPGTTFTKIVYGEPINFTITGQVVTASPDEAGKIKVVVKADGYGTGGTSSIKYKFVAKLQLQATPVNGAFSGKFKGVAKIIGESQERDPAQLTTAVAQAKPSARQPVSRLWPALAWHLPPRTAPPQPA